MQKAVVNKSYKVTTILNSVRLMVRYIVQCLYKEFFSIHIVQGGGRRRLHVKQHRPINIPFQKGTHATVGDECMYSMRPSEAADRLAMAHLELLALVVVVLLLPFRTSYTILRVSVTYFYIPRTKSVTSYHPARFL